MLVTPARYLMRVAAALILIAIATIATCVLIDPYWIFGSPAQEGFNALKPHAASQAMMAKAALSGRIAPSTVLLGNSRTEAGIDPTSDAWPGDRRPVFNHGQAGRDLATAVRLLQHTSAGSVPRMIVVGLDFPNFLGPPRADGLSVEENSRLLVDHNGAATRRRELQVWQDRLTATLTLDAVFDSISTVVQQEATSGATITAHGFNPLNEYNTHVRRVGHHGLFAQKVEAYARQLRGMPAPNFAAPDTVNGFASLKRIIALAAQGGSHLVLYIHPYHAEYLELLHAHGMWPSFEAWKRAVASVVASAAVASGLSVEVIDFAGYDEVNTEPVPPAGDVQTQMRWYWELGHYKSALGDRLIRRFFEPGVGYGHALTPATLDAALAAARAGRERYRVTSAKPRP